MNINCLKIIILLLFRQGNMDSLVDHVTRQIVQVSSDLETIEQRIQESDGKADKMTATDVRLLIDDIESASKVCLHFETVLVVVTVEMDWMTMATV